MDDKVFNLAVGKKLFNARKDKQLSRAELGKRLNLHETTIKRYEDGDIKSLSIEKLQQFADVLGIDPAYLMGWEDSPIGGNDAILAAHKESPFADVSDEEAVMLEAVLRAYRSDPRNRKDYKE